MDGKKVELKFSHEEFVFRNLVLLRSLAIVALVCVSLSMTIQRTV